MISYYISKLVRGDVEQLFVVTRPPFNAASKETLARWICEVLNETHAVNVGEHATAHSTRAVASSTAFHRGLRLEDVLRSVGWRSSNTFTSTYMKDMSHQSGRFASAVLERPSTTGL